MNEEESLKMDSDALLTWMSSNIRIPAMKPMNEAELLDAMHMRVAIHERLANRSGDL